MYLNCSRPLEAPLGYLGTILWCLQSFREELESLIQEQMKKGNNSNIWALQQIAEFMATTAPSVFPPSPLSTLVSRPGSLGHVSEQVVPLCHPFP